MDYDNDNNKEGVIEIPKYCSHCGARLDENCSYCSKCGAEVLIYSRNQESYKEHFFSIHNRFISELKSIFSFIKTSNYLDAELPKYVGHGKEYYINRFQRMKVKNTFFSWNIAALLLGPFWALYRKLYYTAVILFLLYFVIFTFGTLPGIIIISICQFIFSLLANYIYMYAIERKLKKGKCYQGNKKNEYIKIVGDTVVYVPVITALIFFLLSIIIML